jgi:hypothetical protein
MEAHTRLHTLCTTPLHVAPLLLSYLCHGAAIRGPETYNPLPPPSHTHAPQAAVLHAGLPIATQESSAWESSVRITPTHTHTHTHGHNNISSVLPKGRSLASSFSPWSTFIVFVLESFFSSLSVFSPFLFFFLSSLLQLRVPKRIICPPCTPPAPLREK